MGNLFGFELNKDLPINEVIPDGKESVCFFAPHPPRSDGGVEHIEIYSDCVQPTNFGGQSANIAMFTSQSNGGNDFHI